MCRAKSRPSPIAHTTREVHVGVAGRERAGCIGHHGLVNRDRAVLAHAQVPALEGAYFGSREPHRQQHQIGWDADALIEHHPFPAAAASVKDPFTPASGRHGSVPSVFSIPLHGRRIHCASFLISVFPSGDP